MNFVHPGFVKMIGISGDEKLKNLVLNHITSDTIPQRRRKWRRVVTVQLQNPARNDVLQAAMAPYSNEAVIAHTTALQPNASFFPQDDVDQMLRAPETKFKKGVQTGMIKVEEVMLKLSKLNWLSFSVQLR